jgi:hypothetical protein
MNIILILSILAFGAIGMFLRNYWDVQLEKLFQKQVEITSTSRAIDVLNSMFGIDVKINKIDRTKGIGADYYSPINDEFYLTEDTEKYNSASVTIAYFLGLLKLVSTKSDSTAASLPILSMVLNISLIVFITIGTFSVNEVYIYIIAGIYITLIFLEIISNRIYFRLTPSYVTKTFKKNKILISKADLISLNEYVSTRWWQLVTTLLFNRILVSYYFILRLFKK